MNISKMPHLLIYTFTDLKSDFLVKFPTIQKHSGGLEHVKIYTFYIRLEKEMT
jgi:hypothetical protein